MEAEVSKTDVGTWSLKGHGLLADAAEVLVGACVAGLTLVETVVCTWLHIAAVNGPLVEKMQILLLWPQP